MTSELHAALAHGDRSASVLTKLKQYPYLLQLATIECANKAPSAANYTRNAKTNKRRRLVQNYMRVGIGRQLTLPNNPHARLVSFLQLLNHLGKAPWASGKFAANELILMRLTAAHMSLITWCDKPHPSLYDMLSIPHNQPPHPQQTENLIWITNRQQGKTTNIGKFIAALSLAAKPSAMLATVYSTKFDRAGELVTAAKRYHLWMQTEEGKHPKWPSVTLVRDNERGFMVAASATAQPSGVLARPKNPDTCRGDAPSAAFFDEIAFTSADFWFKFALPLFQIAGRRATCTTTPPPPKTFFDLFCKQVKRSNNEGDYFFGLINHSLACSQCIEANLATECCHRLHLVPPWKSMLSIANGLGKLMPKHRHAEFTQEVFGVMAGTGHAFLPESLLKAMLERERVSNWGLSCPTVWVGIDPPAHGKAAMGMSAFLVHRNSGQVVLIGAAAVDAEATEVHQIQMVVARWLHRVCDHPFVAEDSPIVPIVECNNNEILSKSIVSTIEQMRNQVYMPFVSQRFKRYISEGVGVWTSQETTLAALSVVYQALIDGRVSIASDVVVTNREELDPRAKRPPPQELIERFASELGQFGYNSRGKVTGKCSDDALDDLGMSFLIAMYWRVAVKQADRSVSD
ncbi:MAG: hypothetical protein CL678_11910 [Bdellovibrionaceae bacterium]|nr:hypothetical protein [Pseudobdellovibrionaceae bacterium]